MKLQPPVILSLYHTGLWVASYQDNSPCGAEPQVHVRDSYNKMSTSKIKPAQAVQQFDKTMCPEKQNGYNHESDDSENDSRQEVLSKACTFISVDVTVSVTDTHTPLYFFLCEDFYRNNKLPSP